MDATIIVALVAAIAAVIAPIFTAFFNNRKELKLKRIDILQKSKIEVYQSFCATYGALADSDSREEMRKFMGIAYMVAITLEDDKEQYKLFNLASTVESVGKGSTTDAAFLECMRILSNAMKQVAS